VKRFTLDGTDYPFDPAALFDLTIGEARSIKAHTGLTLTDWHQGLALSYRGDPDVLAGIVWLVRRRAGEVVDWAEIDRISTESLLGSVIDVDDEQATEDEAPAPDPVEAPKPTRKRGTAKPAA
jgi:hypothetical protein